LRGGLEDQAANGTQTTTYRNRECIESGRDISRHRGRAILRHLLTASSILH
jgi:hypothetical protein